MVPVLRRRTALHPLAAAAERGHLAAVGKLLELEAPPNHDSSVAAGVLQTTPLMLAAGGLCGEAVRWAHLRRANGSGSQACASIWQTHICTHAVLPAPATCAAGKGHLAVVERLLAAGASPLKANSREETAAALALRSGHLAVVRCLLQHGGELAATGEAEPGVAARPQLSNASRAWQMAFQSGQVGLRGCTSLAALEQERQRFQLLLLALLRTGGGSTQAAAEVRQLAGPAALARAAAGSDALLAALLACGVRLDAADPGGGPTVLGEAAQLGWPTMQRLLQRGADPNQAEARGSTVLMLLAGRPGLADTAQQLLAWAEEREAAAAAAAAATAAAGDGRQVQAQMQAPLLDALHVGSEGRDAVGVALAAKNRRCAELLLDHLARLQQRRQQRQQQHSAEAAAAVATAAAAAGGTGGQAAQAGPPAAPATPPPAGAAAGGIRGEAAAVPGLAAKAFELLSAAGARRLADINKPGPDGRHPLLAQVRGGAGVAACPPT